MANGRNLRAKRDSGRDPGRFIAIPMSVLESQAYLGLSAHARALLIEVAIQCRGDDNGRLLLTEALLKKRGWRSKDTIQKSKRELLQAMLIFETVKGRRPNRASWYALTWRRLGKLHGFDPDRAEAFVQGSYRRSAAPQHGVGEVHIAPPRGVSAPSPTPQHGSMSPIQTYPLPRHMGAL